MAKFQLLGSIKYFFSYSRNDSEFVIKLATDLKNEGLNVWLDQLDISPGTRWDAAVEHALNEAECMLVVLSNSSVKSNNVLDEVSYAINKGKKVIPLLLHDCEVPFRIARFHRVDFTRNYTTGLQLLIRTLKSNDASPIVKTREGIQVKETHDLVLKGVESYPSEVKWKGSLIKPFVFVSLALLAFLLIFIIVKTGKNQGGNLIPDTTRTSAGNDTFYQSPGTSVDTELPKTDTQPPKNTFDKSVLVPNARHKVIYKLLNDKLAFYINNTESPSINVDVNQNAIIDNNVDRSYGITGNDKSSICNQYIISNNSFTGCGVAPSNATLSITDGNYIFTIPLSELRSDAGAYSLMVQFSFYSPETGWTYYPERAEHVDFSKVYKIDIDARKD